MNSRIALHPGMGPALLQHLRQFGDLPTRGILAGQSVDSAITDVYGAGGGVYNDLDIFRNAPSGPRVNQGNWATSLTMRSDVELHLSAPDDDYTGMSGIVRFTRLYGIKSVSRQGMLNFVNCAMADGFMSRRLTAVDVISGFDLNCTRVAIDLATGQLVWDRYYEQFLHSRQLRIVMMHTPWHTFLRLAKKAEELPGVYVDFEAAAQACVAVAHNPEMRALERYKAVSFLFGSKHLEQAQASRAIWTPYFSLEERELVRSSVGGIASAPSGYWGTRGDVASGAVVNQSTTLYSLEPRGQLEPALRERCDKLGMGVVFFASRVVDEARRAVSAGVVQKLEDVRQSRELVQNADLTKPRDFVLLCADTFGTGYVAGQALPVVADKVSAWLTKHGLFKPHLFGLTLAEQHARMTEIAQLARDYGNEHYDGDTEHALGVLELTATTSDLQSEVTMRALLDADRRDSMKQFPGEALRIPASMPPLFADFTVTEMRRPFDLAREGREMRHCVGGYTQAVLRGGSRILSIKFKNHRTSPFCSTVELKGKFRKDGTANGRLKIAQNFTHSNKKPAPENQAFAEFLRDYLHLVGGAPVPDVAQVAQDATAKQNTLLQEDYDLSTLVRQLESQLRAARNTRRRLTTQLDDAQRKAALYTLMAQAQVAEAALEALASDVPAAHEKTLSGRDRSDELKDDAVAESLVEATT